VHKGRERFELDAYGTKPDTAFRKGVSLMGAKFSLVIGSIVLMGAALAAPRVSPVAVAAPQAKPKISPAEISRGGEVTSNYLGRVFGKPLNATDRATVSAIVARDFAKEPQQSRAGIANISNASRYLTRTRGADNIAARKKLLTLLYFYVKNPKPEDAADARTILGMVQKYKPVVAEDAAKKQILTRDDIAGVVASNNFVAKLAGLPAISTMGDVEQASIQEQFVKLPGETRQRLILGEERNARLNEVWRTLTPHRKRLITEAVKKEVKTATGVPKGARLLEDGLIKRAEMVAQARQAAATRRRRASSRRSWGSLGTKMGTFWGMRGALYNFN
jgi:hypothetical protein